MATMSLVSLSSFLTLFIISFPYLIRSHKDSDYYNKCVPYRCGNITFPFPFSSLEKFGTDGPRNCGLPRYTISCDSFSVPSLELWGKLYQVKHLYPSQNLITVYDNQLIKDLGSGICDSLRNLSFSTIDIAPLKLPPWSTNLTFFLCPHGITRPEAFLQVVTNYSCVENYKLYLSANDDPEHDPVDTPSGCTFVALPVSGARLLGSGLLNRTYGDPEMLFHVLADGFPLQWPRLEDCESCNKTGGRCGYDGRKIVCFCRGGCDRYSLKNWKIIIGVATGSIFMALVAAISLLFKFTSKPFPFLKTSLLKRKGSLGHGRKFEQFMKNYQSSLPTKYSYVGIKKMTSSFKDKLGEGGYGNVFKGKLLDGHFVAVKMLEKSRDDCQDFINEVTTIGRIHHVNVIRLLGYCGEGSKRALIYEFMPNGSLGDLISKEEVNHSLGWARLLEIAIGIAHGIEYLHHGCASRILHLDIKPQNVLLDHEFHPKISDFGLAKAYSRNHSVVPLTGARGTIGYIAPEIFMTSLGGASNKSDVYSYGMLLLEMVGARKIGESKTQSSSKTYFPGWIYDKLIQEEDMELIDSVVGEEVYIARKMVMVGLWCIQISPADRPSMTRVVEMLLGSAEAIEMPPKPFFFSPPRVQFDHEISSINSSDASVLPLTFEDTNHVVGHYIYEA